MASMQTIQPPPLDVQKYYIDTLTFRAFDEHDEERDSGGSLAVDFDVHRHVSDPHAFRMVMRINVAAEGYTVEDNPSHGISLTVVGFFLFAPGTDEEQMQRMIRINGSSILYGIARGIVGQATGASQHGQFVLPTVNFVDVAKAKEAAAALASSDEPRLIEGADAVPAPEPEHA